MKKQRFANNLINPIPIRIKPQQASKQARSDRVASARAPIWKREGERERKRERERERHRKQTVCGESDVVWPRVLGPSELGKSLMILKPSLAVCLKPNLAPWGVYQNSTKFACSLWSRGLLSSNDFDASVAGSVGSTFGTVKRIV